MNKVTLVRFESSDHGTFGKIYVEGFTFYTLELPWRDNRNDISCIPSGTYTCKMTRSPRFKKDLYEVLGVKGRFAIRIHSANLAGDVKKGFKSQLNGCIALGEKLGTLEKQKAIFVSKPAVANFEKLMNYEPFILEVTYGFP